MAKTIIDPVHGSIQLTNLESDIVSCPTFQRLHNVRQLGLAHLVFPSANYSRFAHSVGACHNAQRIVQAINRNGGTVSADEERICRLAALLHDIGHYPFSHATEHVVKDVYSKNLLAGGNAGADNKAAAAQNDEETAPYLDHELVGRKLIEHDPFLNEVFRKHGLQTDELKHVFSKERPTRLIGVISSDLDCDRLDYLRRTAHTSGLPYGMVDIDYIIDQAYLDDEDRYCFGRKALRAADHLLVSRYYDYLQIPFHKMVVALEWSLVECMKELMKAKLEDLSTAGVLKKIREKSWIDFDDGSMLTAFRGLYRDYRDKKTPIAAHLRAVLERRAPKMVCGVEVVGARDGSKYQTSRMALKTITADAAKELGIGIEYFNVWDQRLQITKAYSKGDEYGVGEGTVYIRGLDGKSAALTSYPQALMKTLGNYEYSGVRVYVLDHENRLGDIRQYFDRRIRADVPDIGAELSAC